MTVVVDADPLLQIIAIVGGTVLLALSGFLWWVAFDSSKRRDWEWTIPAIVFALIVDALGIFLILIYTGQLVLQ